MAFCSCQLFSKPLPIPEVLCHLRGQIMSIRNQCYAKPCIQNIHKTITKAVPRSTLRLDAHDIRDKVYSMEKEPPECAKVKAGERKRNEVPDGHEEDIFTV